MFEFAAARKLPAIYEYDFLVRDGGLMSYGPDLTESFERAAALVDRIFKGAKPADLPFEQPTRYLFVLNLKTAKSIGLGNSADPARARRRGDRVKRREFIALLGGAVSGVSFLRLSAQSARKSPSDRLPGKFTGDSRSKPCRAVFRALRDLGYVEGRIIEVTSIGGRKGNYDRFPGSSIIASGVDVIVTAGTPAAFAVKNATSSIPCVRRSCGNPGVGTALSRAWRGPAETRQG